MIRKASAAIVAVLVLSACALADEMAPQIGGPRYSFYKEGDGFLRLDSQTGEVALCGTQPVGWACLAAPDDRTVLENEIARLRKENAVLKRDLLSRGLPLPPGTRAEPSASPSDNGPELTLRLPGQADLDRLLSLMGRIWHRLVAAVVDAQNQVIHKS